MEQLPQSAHRHGISQRNRHRWACAGLMALVVATPVALADSITDWQLRRLFHPNEAQLQNERHGRIFIYDRLPDRVAQRAVDEQFDRVEHMMFTNTIITDQAGTPIRDAKTGMPLQEDEGC